MLSPYNTPENLNGKLTSAFTMSGDFYKSDEYDSLDKRNMTGLSKTNEIIDSTKAIDSTIDQSLGSRSPMYTIGERPGESVIGKTFSKWLPNEITGLVRAVTSLRDQYTDNNPAIQRGVIIDGIGEVDGDFSVEFTTNPVLFRANSIIDNRFRLPAKLRMTVMVSNYLNDTIFGYAADGLNTLIPTGIDEQIKNVLAYEGNTRAQYALYQLRWLMENGKPFTVYTPHGIYENMLIKSISPKTDDKKMDMLYCDIEFQEVIFYTPLSGGVGNQPARLSVEKPRKGLTRVALNKLGILDGK